ncbi:hypothetical protein JKP88DRAFT_266361 [Tribonema minus]|uniref:Uncharacterized protein n=1 Tax=Tribonema minus TaxID=303371 RepID=A0A835ZCW6_9STRA|nr:hypothetical protein JKP88DRAFT_266361 [Tribonema minus]
MPACGPVNAATLQHQKQWSHSTSTMRARRSAALVECCCNDTIRELYRTRSHTAAMLGSCVVTSPRTCFELLQVRPIPRSNIEDFNPAGFSAYALMRETSSKRVDPSTLVAAPENASSKAESPGSSKTLGVGIDDNASDAGTHDTSSHAPASPHLVAPVAPAPEIEIPTSSESAAPVVEQPASAQHLVRDPADQGVVSDDALLQAARDRKERRRQRQDRLQMLLACIVLAALNDHQHLDVALAEIKIWMLHQHAALGTMRPNQRPNLLFRTEFVSVACTRHGVCGMLKIQADLLVARQHQERHEVNAS